MRYVIASCAAALCCAPSMAAIQVFNASGLFEDGGVLSGTVSVDESAGRVTAADLSLTGVNDAFTANLLNPGGPDSRYRAYNLFVNLDKAHSKYFEILLPNSLVGYKGGAIYSLTTPSPRGSVSEYFAEPNAARLTSGSLTLRTSSAAPEPAAWALTIVGFGVIGTMKRRRNCQRVSVSVG